jgi:hypothetical protein
MGRALVIIEIGLIYIIALSGSLALYQEKKAKATQGVIHYHCYPFCLAGYNQQNLISGGIWLDKES